MPAFGYGPYLFTFSGTYSGYGPKELRGPDRTAYVVEHQIPAREGGIVEYVGSEQSKYQFKGFIVQQETGGSTAALVLSGATYVAVNADDAKDFLKALRGSGNQVLVIESTYSNMSGYQNLYENGFFFIEKITFGLEAGRSYPYYAYGIDFHGATPSAYGNSSGVSVFSGQTGGGLSGYVFTWQQSALGQPLTNSGTSKGEVINTLGVYILSVASGNLKVAVYSGTSTATATLVAQSAPQAVHSGLNYFPIRPSFISQSGYGYIFAIAGDCANQSGFVIGMVDHNNQACYSWFSGSTYSFSGAFPTTISTTGGQNVSGFNLDIIMVAGV